jgi:lysine-N-methylase
MKNIIKVEIYDDFNCIADQCSFTCCKGWDIQIDINTINKWKTNEDFIESISKNVKTKKSKNFEKYTMNMGSKKSCPFLDEKQLCKIVTNQSDEYLPNTCKVYPRQENSFINRKECSLSCGCPEVVDLLYKKNGQVKFIYDGENSLESPIEFNIREAMIQIMQMDSNPLKDKILFVFQMLLSLKDKTVITKEILNQYLDESYYNAISKTFHEIKVNPGDTITENNELFLDIVYNYKREKQYQNILNDISELGEKLGESLYGESGEEFLAKIKEVNIYEKRGEFELVFSTYEKLMEQCMISKIFSNCISDDMDEIIFSYQIIITEFLMVKHSAFLKWVKEGLNYNNIRDYIVIFSRIIGYNSEGMKEFWEESFDDAIWDYGYLFMLLH